MTGVDPTLKAPYKLITSQGVYNYTGNVVTMTYEQIYIFKDAFWSTKKANAVYEYKILD